MVHIDHWGTFVGHARWTPALLPHTPQPALPMPTPFHPVTSCSSYYLYVPFSHLHAHVQPFLVLFLPFTCPSLTCIPCCHCGVPSPTILLLYR